MPKPTTQLRLLLPAAVVWTATGCKVVSDDQLMQWLDPDGDGYTLADDCDNTDPRLGGPEDPSDELDNDCDGTVERGAAAAVDTYQGEAGSRTAARIAVVDDLGGIIIGPDSTGSGNKVVWLDVEGEAFVERAVWNVDLSGPLGHPKAAIGQLVSAGGDPLFALAFPDALIDGKSGAGCVVLLSGSLSSGEHTLTVDDCAIVGDAPDLRLGADIAIGWDVQQMPGILVGTPGRSSVQSYALVFEAEGVRAEKRVTLLGMPNEGVGEALAWVNQTGGPESDGPYWIIGAPGADLRNGQVRSTIADLTADIESVIGWTWTGTSGEQLGLSVGLAPPVDGTRPYISVESANRALIVDFPSIDDGSFVPIDDSARLIFEGLEALGPKVPFLAEMPDAIGVPADPIYWTTITGTPVDGAPCAGSASASWLVPLELEGTWTPSDATDGICLDDDIEEGVLTAMVSGGEGAREDFLVVGRPSAYASGGRADLFEGLAWP